MAGGSLLELSTTYSYRSEEAAGASTRLQLHVDLVRHVWGVEESDCGAALVSQHGTHVTLRLGGNGDGDGDGDASSSVPPPLRRRVVVVVEIGYDPVCGVDPRKACRGLEPDLMPDLRRVSDVQDGAYLELMNTTATATATTTASPTTVLLPLAIGTLDLGFESAGPLTPPAPASRDAPPRLNLRMKPPFHMQPPPATPAFAYRALLLDVSRHFHPKEDVTWLVDRVADLGLNVLHLHLTDDAGWRVEISKYPELTAIGAWRGHGLAVPSLYGSGPGRYGGFYTKEDIREIVEHAVKRGVEVIPEIDIPGHSYATLRALPHLVEEEAPGASAGDGEGVGLGIGSFPKNCLNPALPQTLEFLTHVLDEVVELFAPCKRVHLGCDEVPRGAFAASPACRQLAEREGYLSENGPGGIDETALVAHLMAPLQAHLEGKDIGVMGWEEASYGRAEVSSSSPSSSSISSKFTSYLRPPATVCAWKGRGEAGPIAARAGFNVVMMPAVHTYLDLCESDHPESPGLYWAAPCLAADDAAAFDPWAGFPSASEDEVDGGGDSGGGGGGGGGEAAEAATACRRRLLGVGAALWGEVCRNREDMAARLFPSRLAEVAKVAWLGGRKAGEGSKRRNYKIDGTGRV